MGQPGVPVVVLAGFYPWSALGAALHAVVLSTVVVPGLLVLLRPSRVVAILLAAAIPVALALALYRLVAPGGFRSTRSKFMTGVALCAAFVGGFCVWLVAYGLLFAEESPTSPLVAAALGLLGVVALVLAAGASLDALLAGAGSS